MQHLTFFHTVLLSYCIWCQDVGHTVEVANLCLRQPHQKSVKLSPGDGGFRITVNDNVNLRQYVPEQVYRIGVTGTLPKHRFSGAYLVAVPHNSSTENVTSGKFHLVDGGRLAFHVACSHVVTTVDSVPKAEVYVMWTSPPFGAGCVEFR